MGGAYFGAVEAPGGHGAYGYVVHADGSIFPASSGGADGSLDTPQGTWAIGDGYNDKYADMNGKKYKKTQYQLKPVGTAEGTPLPDSRYKKSDHPGKRTEVMGHVQHFRWDYGSHGCIAVQDRGGIDQFAKDGTVTVDYQNQSLEDIQKKIEKRLGHDVDWTKIKKPIPPAGSGLGEQSKTQKGNKVKAVDYGVRSGPNARKVTYLTAPLEGGGAVTKGTASITVGPPQHLMAAVSHDTSDGSPIANGEDSIHMMA